MGDLSITMLFNSGDCVRHLNQIILREECDPIQLRPLARTKKYQSPT